MKTILRAILSVLSLVFLIAWSDDPSVNTPICDLIGDQKDPQVVSNEAGGAFIVWYDYRSGNADIYAQKIDSNGNPQWTNNGIVVCNAGNNQLNPQMISDSAGGVIIAWEDYRSGDAKIYAQRISSTGNNLWRSNGVLLCASKIIQKSPQIIPSGKNGAIVAWVDGRIGYVYAQKINNKGKILWNKNGITASSNERYGDRFVLVSDSKDGAIVIWFSSKLIDPTHHDYEAYIKGQKLDSNGKRKWTSAGLKLYEVFIDDLDAVSDGAGGAMFGYASQWEGMIHVHAYAYRVNTNGVIISGGGFSIVPDLLHLKIDLMLGKSKDIYAVGDDYGYWKTDNFTEIKLSKHDAGSVSGFPAWREVISLSSNADLSKPYEIEIAPESDDGIYVVRKDGFTEQNAFLYVNKVDMNGVNSWSPSDVIVCSIIGTKTAPHIVPDLSGGAIIVWADNRTGNFNIYAQKVYANGTLSEN